MIRTFLTGLSVLTTLVSFGQDSLSTRWRLESGTFSLGVNAFASQSATLGQFRNATPQSEILSKDFSDARLQSNLEGARAHLAVRFIIAPVQQDPAKKFRTTYRVGFSSKAFTNFELNYSRERKTLTDSILDYNTGRTILIDSINRMESTFKYISRTATIDAGIQFNTRYEKRFSFFAGIQGSIGVSSYRTRYDYSEGISYQSRYDPGSPGFNYYRSGSYPDRLTERYTLSTGLTYAVAVPFGGQFRFAKKTRFWRRVRAQMEMSPGFIGQKIPDYGWYGSMFFNWSLGAMFDLY